MGELAPQLTFRQILNQQLQKKFRIEKMEKGVVQYATEEKADGFVSTLVSDHLTGSYTCHGHRSKRAAEEDVAQQAVKAEFPAALQQGPKAAPKEEAKANAKG